ncbi:MAG: phosphoribosylanthranilate isomerase [Actinomycetota bacterium]
MFVKICGITRRADAEVAVAAGANAIGFIFAPSPRRVSAAQAAEIVKGIHPSIRKIGVFVDPSLSDVLATVEAAGMTGAQLHGSESVEFAEAVKAANPGLFVYKAVKIEERDGLVEAERYAEGSTDAVMIDRKDVNQLGRGVQPVPLEWLEDLRIERMILAGGLNPENVGTLVSGCRPWGVDVSSGVEESPGKKNSGQVRAFLQAVRQAEASVSLGRHEPPA